MDRGCRLWTGGWLLPCHLLSKVTPYTAALILDVLTFLELTAQRAGLFHVWGSKGFGVSLAHPLTPMAAKVSWLSRTNTCKALSFSVSRHSLKPWTRTQPVCASSSHKCTDKNVPRGNPQPQVLVFLPHVLCRDHLKVHFTQVLTKLAVEGNPYFKSLFTFHFTPLSSLLLFPGIFSQINNLHPVLTILCCSLCSWCSGILLPERHHPSQRSQFIKVANDLHRTMHVINNPANPEPTLWTTSSIWLL